MSIEQAEENKMAYRIRKVQYFYTTVKDEPGEAYRLLSQLADLGVSLLAFTAVPIGPESTTLTLFPESTESLKNQAVRSGLTLNGPQNALLVNGDDELGALAEVHARLFEEDINIYASSGVTDGKGSYGYVLYLRPGDYDRACLALGL